MSGAAEALSNVNLMQESNASTVQSYRIFPVLQTQPWLLETLRSIQRVVMLPANWDSYGSLPPQPDAVEAVFRALDDLKDLPLPPAIVVPVSGGGLQLEWRVSGRELEIEILPDGSSGFLVIQDQRPIAEGDLPSNSNQKLKALSYWLVHGRFA